MLAKGVGTGMLRQPGMRRSKQVRIGTPEAIDGLFLITNQKHAAVTLRVARGHFLKQRQQQPPLRRVGVLKFIDQQVVDSLIEFVLHPFGMLAAVKKLTGFPLEIGKVEQAMFFFEILVVVEQTLAANVPGMRDSQGCVPSLLLEHDKYPIGKLPV